MKNYWQPSIDNWIINENDATAYGSGMNTSFASDKMAGGANSNFTGGIPLKNEEEEEFDKLKQPYKGIKTLKALKEQINQILEDAFNLSKTDKDHQDTNNPYEKIINILKSPDLNTMLEIASNESKNKSISSF